MTTTDEILETLNRLKMETEMAISLVEHGPIFDVKPSETGRLDFRIGHFVIIDRQRIEMQHVIPPKRVIVELD